MYQNSDPIAGFYIAVSYTFLIHTVHFGGPSCDWLVYARGRYQTEVDWKVRPEHGTVTSLIKRLNGPHLGIISSKTWTYWIKYIKVIFIFVNLVAFLHEEVFARNCDL